MRDQVKHYEFVTREANKIGKSWTYTDILNFHYFNPNGLCEIKRRLNARLLDAVNAGKAKSGSLIAYGSCNDYPEQNLSKSLHQKRVNRRKLFVLLEMLQENIETLENFLNEIGG